MRLINTTTFQLGTFEDSSSIPPYAILSHTWGDDGDEITYQEFCDLIGRRGPQKQETGDEVEEKAGYKKVIAFCTVARARGLQYAWADTCCINKRDSLELSEAINSMARWYENAAVCIVYLSDVSATFNDGGEGDIFDQIEQSRWFTRGWTLQELLAPRRLIFYSRSWERLGSLSKDDVMTERVHGAPHNIFPSKRGFLTSLERACHMKIQDLCTMEEYRSASVAQRMFWASHRQTTREEDTSYCLLNLFDVNMPLLYGEGRKAFRRLQEEIIRSNDDESMFAWISPKQKLSHMSPDGRSNECVFARGPADFSSSNNIERTPVNLDRALVVNGNGIDIYKEADHLCIFRRQRGPEEEQLLFVLQLDCERSIPGQLSDPCVIALLADVRKGTLSSRSRIEDILRSPITVERRIMSHDLSTADVSALSDQGFEPLEATRRQRYHFWLPFANPRQRNDSFSRARRHRLLSRL